MARKLTAAEIHPGSLPQHRPKDIGTERRWCDPTPEEIAERCIQIQAGWSEQDWLIKLADRRYLGAVEIAEYHLGHSLESKGFGNE